MVGGVYVRIVGYMSRLYCRERERERAPTRLLFAFIALVRAANKMITIDKLYVDVLILVLQVSVYTFTCQLSPPRSSRSQRSVYEPSLVSYSRIYLLGQHPLHLPHSCIHSLK